MLKYIFAVLLIAAVWATVLLLELPMWIAIVATVVIVGILLTIVIWRLVRAKRAAKEIERALSAQADRHASRARPDLQADIEALKGEFMRAVTALKSSKLGGKKPAEALYALPWYMIIGPPGSGKSTALRNSGLRFPYLSKSGGGVQGVGGTRNCQWWMTNEAVILDTAGRYTTEDSDHDEWISFLDLIKKTRTKAPINGVIVAIAVTDLSDAHPEEVVRQAREIRVRVDEVMQKLEMVVPVYVLFTKIDLLPGFVETFGDLGGKERGQIWGFTFPASKRVADPASAFAEHFNDLAANIERRGLRRMTEERRLEARDKAYEFPQYFEPLRDPLAMFVGELLAENIYSESPIMRGCYFTSGTQEGRPIDRIMNAMAEAFGVQPRIQYTAPQTESKSYFLGELFSKVMFPDKTLASRTAARIKKQRLVANGIAAGLLLIAVGMALLPVLSFRDNRAMVVRARGAVETINEHFATDTSDPIRIEKLLPLRAVDDELNGYYLEGAPWLMRMGMYQGERIHPAISNLYFTAVREELLIPIRDIDVLELKKFVRKYDPLTEPAPEEDHKAAKDRLRMYLLLTGPREKGEPGYDETQKIWIIDRIADAWAKPLELAGDIASKGEMKIVARAAIDILAGDGTKLFERDEKFVKSVRRILLRTDRTQAILDQVISEVEEPELDLRALSASTVALSNDNRVIKGAFTRPGWDNYVRDRLYEPIENLLGDEWVLGRTEEKAQADRDKEMKQLRSAYFERYIAEWKSFLGTVQVKVPDTFADAQAVLNDLTGGEPPPFKRLCRNLAYHTHIEEPPEDEADEAESGIKDAAMEAGGKALAKKGGKLGKKAAEIARKKAEEKKKRDPTLKYEDDVEAAFEGLAKFGFVAPPPAPEDGPGPPPPPVPLDAYQEELKRVRDALKAKVDIDGPEEQKALQKTVAAAKSATDVLINDTDAKGWAPTLEKWLPPPLKEIGRLAEGDAAGQLSKAWCTEVVEPFESLAKRYPFAKGKKDIEIKTVTEYFGRDKGKVWSFYNTTLSSRIAKKHAGYVIAKTGAATTRSINPAVTRFLDRAQDVTDALFPEGADAPLFEFNLTIEAGTETVDTTALMIDGASVVYRNGPYEAKPLQWPGEDDPGCKVQAKGFGKNGVTEHKGEWGFFRILEEATVDGSQGQESFKIEWDLTSQDAGIVKMRLAPKRDATPLYGTNQRPVEFMGVFRHPDLAPPRQLYVGGFMCAGGEE